MNTQPNDQKVTVTFTVNEANTVLAALQEMPYRIADPIIRTVLEQVQPQVQAAQPQEPSNADNTNSSQAF